jgi:hypothetical protein
MVQRLSRRQLGLYGQYADDFRDWIIAAHAVADPAAGYGRRVSKAMIGVVFRQDRFST